MAQKIRHVYILIVFSVLFLDLIFPINLPYVRILIVLNIPMSLFLASLRKPRKEFIAFIFLVFLFFFSATLSSKMYDFLYRDLANIILTVTILPLLFSEIKDESGFYIFKKNLFYCIFSLCTIVSLIGLYKFFLLTTTGTIMPYFVSDEGGEEKFRLGTSLVGDYNYYAYGLIIGLMTIPLIMKSTKASFYKVIISISFILISFNIFFSSSRRGVIILIVYLLIMAFRFFLKRRDSAKKKLNFIGSLIIGVIGIIFVLNYTQGFLSAFDNSNELNRLLDRIESASDSESMSSGRFIRIEEAFKIISEYNLFQLLLGNGFDYLQQIGRLTGISEDYPHNFLVSSALYGGLITVIFTCFFVGLTYSLYRKKGKEYQIFWIWYIMGIFMLMTSKNSLFSVQFINLLFILPYINDVIYKKENIYVSN